MIQGFNKENLSEYQTGESRSTYNIELKNIHGLFLSHKHEDKPACSVTASNFNKSGIDYCLEVDATLKFLIHKTYADKDDCAYNLSRSMQKRNS